MSDVAPPATDDLPHYTPPSSTPGEPVPPRGTDLKSGLNSIAVGSVGIFTGTLLNIQNLVDHVITSVSPPWLRRQYMRVGYPAVNYVHMDTALADAAGYNLHVAYRDALGRAGEGGSGKGPASGVGGALMDVTVKLTAEGGAGGGGGGNRKVEARCET